MLTSAQKDKGIMRDYIINPFTALLVELHEAKKISDTDAQKYEQLIRTALAKGLSECKGKDHSMENCAGIRTPAFGRLQPSRASTTAPITKPNTTRSLRLRPMIVIFAMFTATCDGPDAQKTTRR